MTTLAEASQAHRSFTDVLLEELAFREGRLAAASRIAVGCAVSVVIAMVFQLPQPTYVAYIVFAVSKDEKNATVTAGLGALVAVTLAVIIALGLSIIDTGEPALRLSFMALATFVAMFTSRTFALGPLSYLAGFAIVLLQSLVDDVKSPEALTRGVLWTWVIVLVPVAVTTLVNQLFGQARAQWIERTVSKTLRDLDTALTAGDYHSHLARWRAQMTPFLEAPRDPARLPQGAFVSLLNVLVILEALPNPSPHRVRPDLNRAVRACLRAIESGGATPKDESEVASDAVKDFIARDPAELAALDSLRRFRDSISEPQSPMERHEAAARRGLLVADAFTNAAHWQFAIKTTAAVMVSYFAYTMLDWPGLRTAIVTCFFVALDNLGETVHKLTLRLCGAAIGGLLAALCIVLVFPHLTDIGELCLVIGAASMLAAWVATSSDMLAYGGMQIAFAFFLGALQGYAPASDVTVLRDRLVGILLGNVVVTVIFSSIWPQSATTGIRASALALFQVLSEAFAGERTSDTARAAVFDSLVRTNHLREMASFELRMLPNQEATANAALLAWDLERLTAAAFVIASDSISRYVDPQYKRAFGRWLALAASGVVETRFVIPVAAAGELVQADSRIETHSSVARKAMQNLDSEVDRVISATLTSHIR